MTAIAVSASLSGNAIVRNNLQLYYDPYLSQSYSSGSTLTDLSGQNNHGTLQSSPTKNIDSFTFNGSTQYVSTTTSMSSPSTFTLCAWFNTSASGIVGPIIGFENNQTGTTSNSYYRKMYVGTDNKLYGGIYAGGVYTKASTATVNDGLWHHAAMTWNNSTKTLELFLDGVSLGTTTTSNGIVIYTGYWRVASYKSAGGWPSGGNEYFNGSIGSVQIYSAVITAAQVKQNYYARLLTMV